MSINEVPIVTTRNRHMEVMKLPDQVSTKCVGHCRSVTLEERCDMLGVMPQSLVAQSTCQKLKSLGRMSPVNIAGVASRDVVCV